MERRPLVPDADEVALDQLMVECNTRLVMVLRATGEAGYCPECRQESQRIHSRYRRRLSDLPWGMSSLFRRGFFRTFGEPRKALF